MKKIEDVSGGKKRSILAGIFTIILLLFGGYFGNSIMDSSSEDGYQQNQKIEETVKNQKTEETIGNQETEETAKDQKIEETIENEDKQDSSQDASDNAIVYNFRSEKLWQQHYEKHGEEMGFDNKEDYLLAANKVIENENVLHKLEEEDGDDVYYLEETNEFVIVSTDGYLRTYFNPNDGIRYFNRQ